MPLEISNKTPFTVKQLPMLAPNGANIMQTVVKAAYVIGRDGQLSLCDEHPEVQLVDEYWGEEGRSALRRESDVALAKPYTDLLVLGHVCAPKGRATSHVDLGLAYGGNVLKRLRVSGDRQWHWRGAGWWLSDPEPFVQLPLSYGRAFGGMDEQGSESRNRVGLGYRSGHARDDIPAPNIEHVDALVSSPSDRPAPGGMGVISRDWSPRLEFAGTYDAHWQEEVFPLLPDDFDMRFNQSADPAQWLAPPRGGEQVVCSGLHPEGAFAFCLPDPVLHVAFFYGRKPCHRAHMHLETVLLDAEQARVELTWKAAADVHGDPFDLEETMISREPCVRESKKDCGC
jgi:hypothetical protein